MAKIEGDISSAMEYDPRQVIDETIKFVCGRSEGWVIWSSLLKIVIEPPYDKDDKLWFFYSSSLEQEFLIGLIVMWLMKEDRAKKYNCLRVIGKLAENEEG